MPDDAPRPPRIRTVRRSARRTLAAGDPLGDHREGWDAVELDGVDLSDDDLADASVSGCLVRRCALTGVDLSRARLAETALDGCDASALRSPRSSWRDVTFDACRIGAWEAYETGWTGVRLTGTKIDYLNARASTWRDVDLVGCRVGELDLTDARVERLRLDGCTVETLVVTRSRLSDVDLRGARIGVVEGLSGMRGAWITPDQLATLAPALAAEVGLVVAD